MRYLILTDIHANIDALDAIDEPYDRLLVLGDLVDYGAAPGHAVQWVRERAMAAVSGNHDYAMATRARVTWCGKMARRNSSASPMTSNARSGVCARAACRRKWRQKCRLCCGTPGGRADGAPRGMLPSRNETAKEMEEV